MPKWNWTFRGLHGSPQVENYRFVGMDSVELLIATEKELGITISDEEASQIRTPRNFIDEVVPKVQGRMTRSEIAVFIKQVIIEILRIDESEYREDADFVRDLRMDG